MRCDYAHAIDPHMPFETRSGDTIEPIAGFANASDTREAFRERRLRYVTLGLGFDGAYLIETAVGESHQRELASEERFDRFLQAIEQLTEDQRAALKLATERVAALAMLDELRGLYATGDLGGARRIGERCYHDLRAAFDATPTGEAKLMRPILRTHLELARYCEVALAQFLVDANAALGRVKQCLCAAADLDGGDRAPHETRDDRGRRTAFASPAATLRFPTRPTPVPVIHPALWRELAGSLGITVDEARARYARDAELDPDDESDDEVDHIAGHCERVAALGLRFLVRAIPVIAEDERPALYFPPRDRYGGATVLEDPVTACYRSVESRIARIERLTGLGAAQILIDHEAVVLQGHIDQLAAATAPSDPTALDGWGRAGSATEPRLWTPDEDLDEPSDNAPTMVWLTDDRIAICRDDIVSIVSIGARKVLRTIPMHVQLQTCDDGGRYLVTTANSMMTDRGRMYGFGCVDVETGEWLDTLPAHVPAVSFGKNEPEDGVLYEHRRGGAFGGIGGDRPTALAWSRGNHGVWLSGDYGAIYEGGVRSTATCLEEVSAKALEARCEAPAPTLIAGGTLVDDEVDVEERDRPMYAAEPCALAKRRTGWRFLAPTRHVADLDRTHFRLGFPIDAACFSPDACRLAVLDGGELVIVDVGDRAIVWRTMLDALS